MTQRVDELVSSQTVWQHPLQASYIRRAVQTNRTDARPLGRTANLLNRKEPDVESEDNASHQSTETLSPTLHQTGSNTHFP